jgi:hypothetical protein
LELREPDGPARPAGRILEAVVPEAETETAEEIALPRRRGRKPGSKNRPKTIESASPPPSPKRRGRPPRHAMGSVRSVAVTPELASAALDQIAEAAPPTRAPTQSYEVLGRISPAAMPPAPKRRRGRPRKTEAVKPARADPPAAKVEARPKPVWPSMEFGSPSRARPAAPRAGFAPGERWTRRLRGYAAIARNRRKRKE